MKAEVAITGLINKNKYFILLSLKIIIFILGFVILFSPDDSYSFSSKDKIVAAAFYNFISYDTKIGFLSAANRKNIVFKTDREINVNHDSIGPDFNSREWYRRQIKDMIAAGVNVIVPVVLSDQNSKKYNKDSFINLLETMLLMEKDGFEVPKIAVCFDTLSIKMDGFVKPDELTEEYINPEDPRLLRFQNLNEEKKIQLFYWYIKTAFINLTDKDEYNFKSSEFNPMECKYYKLWAMIDGSPLIFIKEPPKNYFFENTNNKLFKYIIEKFNEDFHIKPRLFPDYSWIEKRGTDDSQQPFLNRGGFIKWGASNYEPYSFSSVGDESSCFVNTAQIGPGYDDRATSPSRLSDGIPVRSRDNGLFFSYSWEYAIRVKPQLVFIETWNAVHDGNHISHTYTNDRKYIHLNKFYSEKFFKNYSESKLVSCNLISFNDENLRITSDSNGIYQIDGGVVRSSKQWANVIESDYLYDTYPETDGKTLIAFYNNSFYKKTDYPRNPKMYFDIDDDFAKTLNGIKEIYVTVQYLDKGKDYFSLTYNSNLHLTSLKVQKEDTDEIRNYTFKLTAPTFNNKFGQDNDNFKYVRQIYDFYIDSMNDGNEYISKVIGSKIPRLFIVNYNQKTFPGEKTDFYITVLNNGIKDKDYEGKVFIESSDSKALGKKQVSFTKRDNGEKIISLIFNKSGEYFLKIYDEKDPDLCVSNLKIIVQKFKITPIDFPIKSKNSKIWLESLDNNGEKEKTYCGEIIFCRPNKSDSVPGQYLFQSQDKGAIIFDTTISKYGKSTLVIEEFNNPENKGYYNFNLRIPECSLKPLEKEIMLSGLKNARPADGKCEIIPINNKNCWKLPAQKPGKNVYLYFDINDKIYNKLPEFSDVYITVSYLDTDKGQFFIEYDSYDSYSNPEGFKSAKTQIVNLAGTKKWKNAVFYLEDAFLGNRTNGADFRISSKKGDLFINQVSVSQDFSTVPVREEKETGVSKIIYSLILFIFCGLIMLYIVRKILQTV